MEMKEVVIEKGVQFTLSESEFHDFYNYFHDRYVNSPINNNDSKFHSKIFDKLEDYRLANLK